MRIPPPTFVAPATSTDSIAASVSTPVSSSTALSTTTIIAPKGKIQALVASTTVARELGLSDRSSMATSTGMLFEFDKPEKYGFWMKDMKFPLDFVWILPNKTVAGVYHNISTSTYPRVYYSRLFVSYVLELNAGGAAKWGIATGTQLVF